MDSTFPKVARSRPGYDIDEVEEFLEEARRAYATAESAPVALTARQIRRTAFAMRKGGYSPQHVDAALERLEDAFANRERERLIARQGEAAWYAQARASAQEILDRLVRPRGKRFTRVSWFTRGYSVREVDALADRVTAYLQEGRPITIGQVRTIAFAAQRGGYQESQVDYLLETLVEVMLAVR